MQYKVKSTLIKHLVNADYVQVKEDNYFGELSLHKEWLIRGLFPCVMRQAMAASGDSAPIT